MNKPVIDRSALRRHVSAVEEAYPLRILGLLPRGSAAHVFSPDAVDFLAEKREGLDLLGLSEAEVELSNRLGREVGIVLVSGLKGRQADELPKALSPL